jgi:hypothetical protein
MILGLLHVPFAIEPIAITAHCRTRFDSDIRFVIEPAGRFHHKMGEKCFYNTHFR